MKDPNKLEKEINKLKAKLRTIKYMNAIPLHKCDQDWYNRTEAKILQWEKQLRETRANTNDNLQKKI